MLTNEQYHALPQLSNSMLSAFDRELKNMEPISAIASLEFGSLVDAMLTEGVDVVNSLILNCDSLTATEIATAKSMVAVFSQDRVCELIHGMSTPQKVCFGRIFFEKDGLKIDYEARCKLDFWVSQTKTIVDLKTTKATTESGFMTAVNFFNYDRQAAFYMDLVSNSEGCRVDDFMIIGQSTSKPHKVWKIKIKRGDKMYNSGLAKYQDLMTKYDLLK